MTGDSNSGNLIDDLRALALELAMGAAKVVLASAPTNPLAKSSPTDIVTDADRAAEEYIFTALREARPHDTILSEEGAVQEGNSGIRWVIDPLDGTVNYLYGIPQWCISIGSEGKVRVGVVYDAVKDEAFTDADKRYPSTKTDLADCLIGTGFSYSRAMRERQAEVVSRVLPAVRDIRRAGSCALDLAWVAAGRLDAFYEDDTHAWDISAGLTLVEAAGGAVETHGALTMAAGNIELLHKLRELVL